MRNPNQLRLVASAEDLAVAAYAATQDFPRTEIYGLASQIRRAAVSIGSNVTEGCGRQGNRALLAFLHQALGSANEIQFQLRIAIRLGFGSEAALRDLIITAESVGKQTSKLISALRTRGE